MQSAAATVDDFLKEQPENLRTDLVQLRALVRTEAPRAREGMKYGMPGYHLEGGSLLCGFNAQKHNLAFYVGRIPATFRRRLEASGFNLGKGCVRFKKLDSNKVELLRSLLREVVAKAITC